jgi:predicted GTPase
MGKGHGQRPTRVLIMGAAGRDFHNFNMVFRGNRVYRVIAFTAAQIPGIANRRYPRSLAGSLYPKGIPILREEDLETIVRHERIDWVYFAYSDVPHIEVMNKASRTLAAGANFGLLGPEATMLKSRRPVIAVCAVRTGAGKSQTSQRIVRWFRERGHGVAVLRHPMPYGDLERQAVQRFATMSDLDEAQATIEEREEYEPYVRMGVPVFAGVDYGKILAGAEREADLVLWDGGNNDFPFIEPDLHIVVLDPHRAGHETAYHPGETNFRMAHLFIINKADSAPPERLAQIQATIRKVRPGVPVVLADSTVVVDRPELVRGRSVVIVGDGPTLTHGGMDFSAGTLAAQRCEAEKILDPRPYAVGSISATFRRFPHLSTEVPAMGYSPGQVKDLQATLNNIPADTVIDATPVDLSRLIRCNKPIASVEYALRERGPLLTQMLGKFARDHLAVKRR